MIKRIATDLCQRGSDTLLDEYVYGYVETGKVKTDNTTGDSLQWYTSEIKGKSSNSGGDSNSAQKISLERVITISTATDFTDNNDNTYTIEVPTTPEANQRVYLNGVLYFVYDIVTDTSFKITAYKTGLSFTSVVVQSRKALPENYAITIDPDTEEVGTIKIYRSVLADITQKVIDSLVSDGFGDSEDYEIV